MVSLLVDVRGAVIDSRVQRSSDSKMLDEAALSALAACKFTPAQQGGKAVRSWATVGYVWSFYGSHPLE